MANFHTDSLVIAANEEDMKKVLVRMAMNLAANKEYTDFDINDIVGLDTVKELFYEVGPAIDAYYIFAFAGAPIPEGVAEGVTPGWTSSTSSEDGFTSQLKVIMQFTEQINENLFGNANAQLVVAKPTGRAMSDSADVGLNRYGENWVLEVSYSTAWSPNSEDLDIFFMGLPAGDYGVAFYDADEYDGYESISVFGGLHHGCAAMHDIEGEYERDTLEQSELKERKRGYAGVWKAGITDLAELAKMTATCGWREFWGDFDNGDCYEGDDSEESVSFWDRPAVNWANPKEKDLRNIDKLMLSALGSFPWCHLPDGGFSAKGNEATEYLFPGDAVTVTSDWESSETPGKVVFNVCDASGTRLGIMDSWMDLYEGWEENKSSSAALACLLPHLTTTVNELTPVSLRNKGVEGPKFSIRFDIEPIDFDELLAETHALLEKDLADRTLSSKGGE